MATTTWKVWNLKWYRAWLGEQSTTHHGKLVSTAAKVGCVTDQGLVNLWFTSSEPLPKNYYGSVPNIVNVFLPLNRYPWYMDVLRNEGPHELHISDEPTVLLHINMEEPGEGDQTSSWEPTDV